MLKTLCVAGALTLGLGAATYGTIDPCTAVHAKAYDEIAGNYRDFMREHKLSGAAFGVGFLALLRPVIGAMIDQKIADEFGSSGPFQCAVILVGFDWGSWRHDMRAYMENQWKIINPD